MTRQELTQALTHIRDVLEQNRSRHSPVDAPILDVIASIRESELIRVFDDFSLLVRLHEVVRQHDQKKKGSLV